MLLGRERERVDEGLPVLLRLAGERDVADRVRVGHELLGVERLVVEVLPPLRLVLAAVVLEQVGEEPPRLALLRAREQGGFDALPLLEQRLRLLARLPLLRRRPPGELGRTELQQPAVQLVERAAVLLVVGADRVEDVLRARLQPLLERDGRAAPAADVLRALEAVELLDLLDRVAVEREPERLLRDPIEVDEHLAAEQLVELGLARPVLAHQALERRPLIRRVVVDVHAGEPAAALVDQVEQALEPGALGIAVERPDAVVLRDAVVVEVEPAEQVLEAAPGLVPGVALEVEPDVAGRRLR